jgi:organic hydroperoxide reductase OsmC/OhrA
MPEFPLSYAVRVAQAAPGQVGSEGRVARADDPTNPTIPVITVQSPAEFLGPKGATGETLDWTPEHLFVSSIPVCYFTTFISIAERSKLAFSGIEVTATGTLDKNSEGVVMITRVDLRVRVTVPAENVVEKARRIAEKVEGNCFIVASVKSEVHTTVEVVVA